MHASTPVAMDIIHIAAKNTMLCHSYVTAKDNVPATKGLKSIGGVLCPFHALMTQELKIM